MKNELIDISHLSDSREVMSQKTPRSINLFILIVTTIVIASLIFACFGKIETYVKASGEIRPSKAVSTVTAYSGGKISNIAKSDGEIVNKGDIILTLDCDYYEQQKSVLENQISEKTNDIQNYYKLISAIKNDENCFDEITQLTFYNQYKVYESEVNNSLLQIEKSNKQIQNSIDEIERAISDAQSSLSATILLNNDYQSFYNAISNDQSYNGTSQTLIDLYNNYVISSDKARAVYNGYVLQYNEINKQNQSNPELVPYDKVEQALYLKDAAYADLRAVKYNLLIQLNERINNLAQQIQSTQTTIDNYILKKESLVFDTSSEVIVKQIKETYYLNNNQIVASLNQELVSLEGQLLNINETISKSSLKAEQDGIIMYSKEYSNGDIVSTGETIGSIIPSNDSYRIIAYIPEHSIADIRENQKVEYVINSISNADFGKIYGTITEISEDSFIDQSTGQKYYKAICSVQNNSFTSKEGITKVLKSGMLVEVRAITGQKKIIIWLLEKLNFI